MTFTAITQKSQDTVIHRCYSA